MEYLKGEADVVVISAPTVWERKKIIVVDVFFCFCFFSIHQVVKVQEKQGSAKSSMCESVCVCV